MVEEKKSNYEKYEASRIRGDAIFDNQIEIAGQRAFDYGKLCINYAFLANGGALIALPATAGISGVQLDALTSGSFFFVGGLALVILAAYFTHLNYLYHFDHATHESLQYEKRNREAHDLSSDKIAEKVSDIKAKLALYERLITVTFWLPHISGIGSYILFCLGALRLVGAI